MAEISFTMVVNTEISAGVHRRRQLGYVLPPFVSGGPKTASFWYGGMLGALLHDDRKDFMVTLKFWGILNEATRYCD